MIHLKKNGGIATDCKLSEFTDSIGDFTSQCEPAIEKILYDNSKKCPHCGASYYMENYHESTLKYFPPIYKNGVNINPDRNIHTTHCTCMECKKDFSYTY